MKISLEQLEKVAEAGGRITPRESEVDSAFIRLTDADLVKQVVASVMEMPDREEMVAELKARIEAGDYNPGAEEIVDAMLRRAKADSIR
ncbi:MAG: flagellar biosynthesis anti-sigma factor FlgM [Fimbriimonadaceae bacterium]